MAKISLEEYKKLTGLSEKDWQRQVVELSKTLGWLSYHTWNSIHSTGGFPDLVLVRERLVMAELKSEKGKVTKKQQCWFDILRETGTECYIWRPSQFDEVLRTLTKRETKLGGRGDER